MENCVPVVELKINKAGKECPICEKSFHENVGRYIGSVHPFCGKDRKLLRCPDCDLVYMHPMPKKMELDDFYARYWYSETPVQNSSPDALQVYRVQSQSRVDFLLEQLGSFDDKSILDFGAGQGFFGQALKKCGVRGVKYYAVETDNQIVETLVNNGVRAATTIEALGNRQYDLVVISHVLEHMPEPLKFIKMITRYIKCNGTLFIEVPNRDYIWKKYYEPHVLFFSSKAMGILLKNFPLCNLKILSCGRRLEEIPNERRFVKRLRHHIGNLLRTSGLRRLLSREERAMSEDTIKGIYETDTYGEERQWFRVIAKKS